MRPARCGGGRCVKGDRVISRSVEKLIMRVAAAVSRLSCVPAACGGTVADGSRYCGVPPRKRHHLPGCATSQPWLRYRATAASQRACVSNQICRQPASLAACSAAANSSRPMPRRLACGTTARRWMTARCVPLPAHTARPTVPTAVPPASRKPAPASSGITANQSQWGCQPSRSISSRRRSASVGGRTWVGWSVNARRWISTQQVISAGPTPVTSLIPCGDPTRGNAGGPVSRLVKCRMGSLGSGTALATYG